MIKLGAKLLTEAIEVLNCHIRGVPIDTEDLAKCVIEGYGVLGMEMPEMVSIEETLEVDFIIAKLVRHASNFCYFGMTHLENWEDQSLGMDLGALRQYIELINRPPKVEEVVEPTIISVI